MIFEGGDASGFEEDARLPLCGCGPFPPDKWRRSMKCSQDEGTSEDEKELGDA